MPEVGRLVAGVVIVAALAAGCSDDDAGTASPSEWDCASIEVGDAIPEDFSSRSCEPSPDVSRQSTQCLDGREFMLLTIKDSHLGGFDGGEWERTDGPPAGCTDVDH